MHPVPHYQLAERFGYITLSRDESFVAAFDAENRLFHTSISGITYRFGQDGRVIRIHPRTDSVSSFAEPVSQDQYGKILSSVGRFLDTMAAASNVVGENRLAALQNNLSINARTQQQAEFENLYGSVPILPPDCYRSLLFQVAPGCSHNRCTFCRLYRNQTFRIRGMQEFRSHIRAVLAFQGQALSRWRSVFLGDANALIVPQRKLLSMIRVLKEELGQRDHRNIADTLYAFSDGVSVPRSHAEYTDLRAEDLKRVYLGLETGCWFLRKEIGKPGDLHAFIRTIFQLKRAGISVGIIVLAGLARDKAQVRHVKETSELLRDLPLDAQDLLFVSPLRGKNRIPKKEVETETDLLLSALREGFPSGPKTVVYDLERFVY